MFRSILMVILLVPIAFSCGSNRDLSDIQPKSGDLVIPAKGELRMWKDIQHPTFEVVLTNANIGQSCEVYYVRKDGTEKWMNPSLLANSKLSVSIPADGHLFIKNFNPNELTISYKINP